VKSPFRKVVCLSDWLDNRAARVKSRQLRAKFAPLVAAAEQNKNWNERDRLLSDWGTESDFVNHPIYARSAERLLANARKYGITVPRQPTSYDEESDTWYASNATGFWLLTNDAERRLRREIRDERRASYDEIRKWATLIFALAGFTLGLISLLWKQKQPDPCQRNYYRNDRGECVFAPQATPLRVPHS
jgi:hypothetical protein